MTKQEHIDYWLKSAEHDLKTAQSLFKSGKYDWCLFIGHLVLEKTLKALFVNANENNGSMLKRVGNQTLAYPR
jgi:HEPN domain-containing protein